MAPQGDNLKISGYTDFENEYANKIGLCSFCSITSIIIVLGLCVTFVLFYHERSAKLFLAAIVALILEIAVNAYPMYKACNIEKMPMDQWPLIHKRAIRWIIPATVLAWAIIIMITYVMCRSWPRCQHGADRSRSDSMVRMGKRFENGNHESHKGRECSGISRIGWNHECFRKCPWSSDRFENMRGDLWPHCAFDGNNGGGCMNQASVLLISAGLIQLCAIICATLIIGEYILLMALIFPALCIGVGLLNHRNSKRMG